METMGEIGDIYCLVLFDLGASYSFISPSLLEQFGLLRGLLVVKQIDKWQSELATSSKWQWILLFMIVCWI